jgi:hypothetical protein
MELTAVELASLLEKMSVQIEDKTKHFEKNMNNNK